MKMVRILRIIAVLVALFFSTLAYTGMWIPTQFGAGTLWLYIAIILSLLFWNYHVDEKESKRNKQ